jgi:hypothetical protein
MTTQSPVTSVELAFVVVTVAVVPDFVIDVTGSFVDIRIVPVAGEVGEVPMVNVNVVVEAMVATAHVPLYCVSTAPEIVTYEPTLRRMMSAAATVTVTVDDERVIEVTEIESLP